MWDFYRNNQQAFAELRAPIYEEKVVDHILGLAKVEDRKVTAAELLKADEDEKLEPEAAAGPEAAPGPEAALGRRRRPSRSGAFGFRRRVRVRKAAIWPPFRGSRGRLC